MKFSYRNVWLSQHDSKQLSVSWMAVSPVRCLWSVKLSPWSASSRWWPTRTRRTAATSRPRRAASTTISPQTWLAWSSWRRASGRWRRRSTLTPPTTRETTGTKNTALLTWTAWRLMCKSRCDSHTATHLRRAAGADERRDKRWLSSHTFLPSETERRWPDQSGWP